MDRPRTEKRIVPSKFSNLLRYRGVLALFLFLLAFVAYSVTLGHGFVYDDHEVVANNRWIRDFTSLPMAFFKPDWYFTEGIEGSNYYRPMMILFHTIGYHLFGLKPLGFHLISVLLHSFNTVLVFLVASVVMEKKAAVPGGSSDEKGATGLEMERNTAFYASFAAVVFALHPVNTEPVSWVSSVSDLLFVFFTLLAFFYYASAQGRPVRYILSVIFFVPALFAKETALVLPVLLFVYDRLWRGGVLVRWKHYLPLAVVAVAYLVIRGLSVGGVMFREQVELTNFEVIFNIFPLVAKYTGKLLLPSNLNALYVYKPANSLTDLRVILSLLLTFSLLGIIYLSRKDRIFFLGLFLVYVPLLPVLYIPALQTASFADRYLYLPTAGFGILLGYGLIRLQGLAPGSARLKPVAILAAVVLMILYGAGTIARSMVWQDDLTLWSDTVDKSPDSANARYNLAWTLHKNGLKREAVEHYNKAVRLDPDKEKAHFNLAIAYQDLGENRKAIEHYTESVRLGHRVEEAHYNMAASHVALGDLQGAISHYVEALRINPGNVNARYNLAWTYHKAGDKARAVAYYKEVISMNPDSVDALFNLGSIYMEMGMIDAAIEEFRAALRIDPGYKDARSALSRALYLKEP